MALELVDESDIKGGIKKDVKKDIINQIKKEEKSEIKKEVSNTKGGVKDLSFVSKDDMISCERTKLGMANNCTLCEVLNTDIFDRCKNKYSGV